MINRIAGACQTAEQSSLKIIAHAAGSVKHLMCTEVWRRKITVTTAAPALGIGVAEFALGLLITGLKQVYPFRDLTRRGLWREESEKRQVREFYGLTIGVVGAGFAGRHLLRLLRAFDIRRLLYDPTLSSRQARRLGAEKSNLPALMRRADAITLHAPDIPATRQMINAEMLSLMKPGALLVNTARGSLIDEAALIAILRQGRIFACLDVTDPEPPAADSPFRTLDNVLLTPHIAGAVNNSIARLGHYATDELERFFHGQKPAHPVTRSRLGRIA